MMNAIDRRIEEVKGYAQRDFANHQVTVMHEDGLYRTYRCAHPESGYHHFYVNTFPYYVTIVGDIGDMVFSRAPDMLEFARGNIDSIGYFAEKCVAGKTKENFCWDRARDFIEEERATLKAELTDATEYEDPREQTEILSKLEILADLEHDINSGDEDAFKWRVYEEYSDCDCEILDNFWNYSYEFLRIREALKLLLRKLDERD